MAINSDRLSNSLTRDYREINRDQKNEINTLVRAQK